MSLAGCRCPTPESRIADHVPSIIVRILITSDPMGATLAQVVDGVWISKDADYAIALVRAIREGLQGQS